MTTKHTRKPVTEIAYLLDLSESMRPYSDLAVACFNEFLHHQRAHEAIVRITLVLFDERFRVVLDNLPVDEVCELDGKSFCFGGRTALLDAIGRTERMFVERHSRLERTARPDRVVFAIFTDGREDASSHYTWQNIADLLKDRQMREEWEFRFLASGLLEQRCHPPGQRPLRISSLQ